MNVVRMQRTFTCLAKDLIKPSRKWSPRATPLFYLIRPTRRWYSSSITEDFIVQSPYGTIDIPKLPLHEYLWQESPAWDRKVAVECGITGRNYTYSQVKELSKVLTASLQNKFGLKKGDSLAIVLPNLPEFCIVLMAGSQGGVVVTTVNPLYTPEEISKQLDDSNAKLVFTTAEKFSTVEAAIKLQFKDIPVVVVDDGSNMAVPPGGIPFSTLLDSNTSGKLKKVDVGPEDTLVLPYSSGTTGLPKGVELTHSNVVSNVEQMKHPTVRLLLHTTETTQESVLCILPMFHIYGLVIVMMTTLQGGGKLVTLPKFDPPVFLQTLVKSQIGMIYLVPPLVLFLAGHPAVKPEHLASVRVVMTGAAPCGEKDLTGLLLKKPDLIISQGYGLTEASPCVLHTHKSRRQKYSSTGVPVASTSCKVVDTETRKSLPAGQVGEVLVHGPQVMKGYFNRPEANKETFENGWLRTGDLGYYDEEGDFYIIDRIKELIKVKGLQVAPAELEEILRTHPKLIDAAVIGVPDTMAGELPKAFVVVKPGVTATEEEVKDFVSNKVAKHKRLEGGVVFLDSIPKSLSGKILRKNLKAEYLKK